MANTDPEFARRCREAPDQPRRVVITLAEGATERDLGALGVSGHAAIEGLDGICVATVTGRQYLALSKRPEIEDIAEDIEQHTRA
ncbi:MAG: hypothetical protein QF926_10460 [Alphaproteobacteria bacterium]|jgi:hypothetical protein|nr:hypothetical protein [Alphaproteobacteria bacterium]MDP6517028.1 hypothetical protein [Alphaproteobacteria bacterium]|tara:strand:- start:89 stop:343 length:255 start_codon:yes stop_codon:yes gene_type:complete